MKSGETKKARSGWENPPIRIDREGRFWNEDEEIVHERMLDFLRRHLRPVQGGAGWEIYVSERERKPVQIEDVPYQVVSCRDVGGPPGGPPERILIRTYDGAEEFLVPETLHYRGNVPYCLVKDGAAGARFSRQAAQSLSHLMVEQPDGRIVLRLGSGEYELGRME